MPATVSVIVCAYNEQAYLADCLYSLKAQTLRPQELLVVDNASTDATGAVARQVPGVVGSWESVATDSFTSGLLKYPQYTRPAEFRGKAVPEVLRSGNHREIERWRKAMALKRTLERRPAILAGSILETIRSPEKGKNPD